MSSASSELLCVLVDVSATSWRELEDLATRDTATSGEAAPTLPTSVSFGTFVSALAAFATLFQLNDRWNRLAVLAFDESSSTQVFPGRDGFGEEPVDPRLLAETLRRELPRLRRRSEKALHEEEDRPGDDAGSRKEAEAAADAATEGESGRRVRARTETPASRSSRSALVRALSQSLCFIHADQRRRGGVSGSTDAGTAGTAGRSGGSSGPADVAAVTAVVPGGGSAPGTAARVLVCSGARDDRTSYVSFMNAVFSAESRGVAIDACDLNRAVESAYLAQAAHLSGGHHVRVDESSAGNILQFLITYFLGGPAARGDVRFPHSSSVDLRPMCFLTHERIDCGFVCTICLAVFKRFCDTCPVCGTKAPAGGIGGGGGGGSGGGGGGGSK